MPPTNSDKVPHAVRLIARLPNLGDDAPRHTARGTQWNAFLGNGGTRRETRLSANVAQSSLPADSSFRAMKPLDGMPLPSEERFKLPAVQRFPLTHGAQPCAGVTASSAEHYQRLADMPGYRSSPHVSRAYSEQARTTADRLTYLLLPVGRHLRRPCRIASKGPCTWVTNLAFLTSRIFATRLRHAACTDQQAMLATIGQS